MASFSAFFTVNQTQQALVLQFGEPKRTIQEPGLAFKLPFIQDVIYYEKRVLSLIPQDAEEVILSDQKRLQVAAYARYQIEDPLLFYQTVRNELGARGRLEAIIDSSVRRALGRDPREVQQTRGEGDGEAIKIYADSFGQDAEFFAFYRSMEAYRKSIGNSDTSMVLSPDSSFFRFFKDKSGDASK